MHSGTAHLSDAEFLAQFERCEISNADFHHFDHIRLGWIMLSAASLEAATERMVGAITTFAVHNHGDSGKFHDTITRVWMRLIKARMKNSDKTFREFADRNPELFNKQHMFDFYSEGTLMSDAARTGWVEPDIKPLP